MQLQALIVPGAILTGGMGMGTLDTFGLQFVTIDGFADFHVVGGALRMTAYRLDADGQHIPILGIDITESARAQLRERALTNVHVGEPAICLVRDCPDRKTGMH